ncbi:LysR family transcriptional regulator ArgP [Streptomyces candidus]|uniref:HTH-type transcriptional regulator LysG n=1 Tax=Streptomyces candidus TaxID=67283 RepID=A0A7X0HKK6_9ACTN|nr:LysR family transcriptional regulator ArgP [Streptomyces candidus]MBB6439301.1 LysR family transcriptional regulator (chromosome initiation inhibitor) [Streptomyces candidus]
MDELPLEQVTTLLAVVDEGTFDAAAAALHVTPSAVSQRVKALEQRTGRVLLMRTKPVRPTESGRVLVRFARQLSLLERDARAELGLTEGAAGAGNAVRLAVAVNADSLATWFLPALSHLPQDPPICVELRREDEGHTTAMLREGRVMAAVTSSPDPVAGCTVRALGLARYLPVASPEFEARYLSEGRLVDCLQKAPVIAFDRKDDLQDGFVRSLAGGEEGATGQGASPVRHYVPTSEGFCDAIIAGLGWGLVPEQQAVPLLRAGALSLLATDRTVDVPLYWQQWKLDSPALAAVADAVLATAAAELLAAR